ncbi:PREDICTED: SAP30-binding protein [Ceratosolen solmsi marchali]|uniref:SAP30-binding protein n=1 Tax=Ceratosolen solmsi marchali TaxID=326594 RepID=A0AAJ7DTV5_9HYME|nr:PREDICTED: SAP30-binding protein [Ceratosolen solmsi marchali]XP_011496337.1 PREDICTED: SAP30-binding protein [Ceratosolen solmsi marchali]XP_011496338.1 PREDICTED: SAP30-binding protein [Ceratosolen solmsi marchali]XP_011496340.1 PREDICTED: SAP30-binding protein [Ceratosolen solmsi marchali]
MSVQSVALASLTATYTDSEGEDGVDEDLQENSNTPREDVPQNIQAGHPQVVISPKSGTSASNSPINNSNIIGKINNNLPNAPTLVTDVTSKVQRLVSYFDDTIVSDDEGTVVPVSEVWSSVNGKPLLDIAEQQSPDCQGDLISDGETNAYGIIIPPDPSGSCPIELQEKITNLYRKMESGRLDMNKLIQQRKDFRNPSIYEKLIQYCSINELGTNYPPDRFDPFKWNKDSYYEELAKIQKVEMEKLEKARKEKTKIEIVSGTAKRQSNTTATVEEDAKKRKSKWDQVSTIPAAAAAAAAVKPGVIAQPALTTLTSSVTGTKATVISAFGSLPKKRL